MGLVDNEHFEAVTRRRKRGTFTQFTGIIHTTVAGRVNLHHIEAASTIARQISTGFAHPARFVRGAFRAVQTAGEDARRGGLSAAARTRKQVGVADAP